MLSLGPRRHKYNHIILHILNALTVDRIGCILSVTKRQYLVVETRSNDMSFTLREAICISVLYRALFMLLESAFCTIPKFPYSFADFVYFSINVILCSVAAGYSSIFL